MSPVGRWRGRAPRRRGRAALVRAGRGGLGRSRAEIDALNVFPVPDGDTGTNLYLTVGRRREAVDAVPADADAGSAWRRWRRARCWAPAATPA